MYSTFFELQTQAFQASPDPHFLYVTPQIREAIACLQYGITERKGFVVMTGEVGTGKTTLLKSVLSWLPADQVSTAFLFNPRLDVIDFLEFVLTDFGIAPRERSKAAMLLQLNRWLIERYRERALCVIVVDEAQDLSLDLLEEIRLLTNLETPSGKLLQIVLSGQPELEDTLRLPILRQLRQRIAVWARTKSLTAEETQAYVAERLHIAGAQKSVFSAEAVEGIFFYSKGIPRVVNLLCEHAMISAFVEQIKPIPARLIEDAALDLGLLETIEIPSPSAPFDRPDRRDPVSIDFSRTHAAVNALEGIKK